jgi:hypothetical protein
MYGEATKARATRATVWLLGASVSLGGCTLIADLGRFGPDDETDSDGGLDGGATDGGTDAGRDADVPDCDPPCGDGRACCDGVCRAIDVPSRCGACDRVCGDPANADGVCEAAACTFACREGFADCNGMESDGCETDVRDPDTCGCDTQCEENEFCEVTDGTAACVTDCSEGRTRCGGSCVDAWNDPSHCGGCNRLCATPVNGSIECSDGACEATCEDGFGDCNADAHLEIGDGCETDLTTGSNCMTCGNVCPVPANAAAVCGESGCSFSCLAGFADCNGVAADGCEADLASAATCGSCSTVCSGTTPNCSTQGGVTSCVDGCPSGSALCGESCVSLSSPSHCGACGVACDAERSDGCNGTSCRCGAGAACGVTERCCGGACVPRWSDHCAACDAACDLRTADTCSSAATCACGTTSSCGTTGRCCGGDCISAFPDNCRGCGVACDTTRSNVCLRGDCLCGRGPECEADEVCVGSGSTAVCEPVGGCITIGECLDDAECCSRSCARGRCLSCAPAGAVCSSSSECCSSSCARGLCATCTPSGGECSSAAQCCSGLCRLGFPSRCD